MTLTNYYQNCVILMVYNINDMQILQDLTNALKAHICKKWRF